MRAAAKPQIRVGDDVAARFRPERREPAFRAVVPLSERRKRSGVARLQARFVEKAHVDKRVGTLLELGKEGLGQLRTRAAIRGGAVDEVVEIDHSLVEKQVEYMCLVFGEGRQMGPPAVPVETA